MLINIHCPFLWRLSVCLSVSLISSSVLGLAVYCLDGITMRPLFQCLICVVEHYLAVVQRFWTEKKIRISTFFTYIIIYIYIYLYMYFIFIHIFFLFVLLVEHEISNNGTCFYHSFSEYANTVRHCYTYVIRVRRYAERSVRACSDRSSCLFDIFRLSKWGILRCQTARGVFFLKL